MPAEAIARAPPLRGGRIARLVLGVRRHGVGRTLRKLFADHVFRRSTSVVMEYRAGWGATGRAGVRPDWLNFAVVRDAAELPPLCDWLARRRAAFVAMLDAGKIALLALRDGVVIGCLWVSRGDHRDPASREFYAVGPDEAYHYCWLVDPAARHGNVALPFGRFVMQALAAMGVDRQFGVVDRANRASYLIQRHAGYRECGVKVMHYVVLGHRRTRILRYDGVLGPVAARRAG